MSPATPQPLLEVDGVGKTFRRNPVLKHASFSATPGRVTALLGRNGTGKSTLLKIAVGRVRADYGRAVFAGRILDRPRLAWLARRGLMYNARDSCLTPVFRVKDHLRAIAGVYDTEDQVREVVSHTGIGELMDRRPGKISGGERQRVAVAMALLRGPMCLLCDEPFVGLNPKDRDLVRGALRRLRESGCVVVITGHEVEDLLSVADEIIWVVAGTSHWLGGPQDARAHHQFRREYLGWVGGAPGNE